MAELQSRYHRMLTESPFSAFFEKVMVSFAFQLIKSGIEGYDSRLIPLQQEENALLSRYDQLVTNAKAEYRGKKVSRASLTPEQQSPDRDTRRAAYQAAIASWEAQRGELEAAILRKYPSESRRPLRLRPKQEVPPDA